MRVRRLRKTPAHLEITAFINLIVVLVPFLLSTAVFTRPLGDRGILYVADVDTGTGTGVVTLQPLDATAAISGERRGAASSCW